MARSTYTRSIDWHAWPVASTLARSATPAAQSGAALASTIIGSLPPSSRLAGMTAAAAAAATLRPVATEPVKAT
ncbi:hypothetical protein GCM10007973_30220 [Polymorphobacter multimanifer]|nr:hypothetical protein GCM10007973_30220 [Polymorphobacter multimanifer]